MYIPLFHRLVPLCLLVLLSSCTTPSASEVLRPTVSSTPFSRELEAPSTTTPIATQTVAAATSTSLPLLPANWHRVAWQGLSVSLPSEAAGIISSPTTEASQILHQIPVLATGFVALPPVPTPTNGAIGEYPPPPSLTLLQFAGTLEAWIALEEQALAVEEGGVNGPVETLIIAGQPARHYRRTLFGFSYNDYYVFKPTATTLLLIYTDKETYGPLVDGLAFVTP